MVKSGLYLITGIKKYPTYTGDTSEEYVKLLVPGNDCVDVKENLKTQFPNRIDEIKGIKHLYDGKFDNYIVDLAIV